MPGSVLPWSRPLGLLGPGALLPFAVVSAGVVAALGFVSAGPATAVGAAAAGLTALVSGPVLLARWWRAGRGQSFRAWIGWAVTIWGLGEMLQARIALTGTPTFPTPGDLVSLSAAVPAVVGALKIPRRGRHGEVPDGAVRWRLPVDAALIAVTAALLVWQFAFLSIFTADDAPLRFDGDSLTAVFVLVSDVAVTAVAFLVGIRDLDRDMLLVSLGTGCYTVGDLVTIHTILGGGVWPWQGAVLWCLAWPLIAVGLVRYEPLRGRDDADADPDARVVLVTTYAALGLLALGVVLVIGSPSLQADVVSLWLVVAALGLLAGREWLNARMRARLLGRLRTEATTDPLTGLANRRELVRRLGAVRSPQDWSLLAVDLDGFKEVNAVLGHPTGDRLLQAAATRIAEVAPTGSLVSRSGGDEFAVLVPAGVVTAATVGERLVTAVHRAAAEVPGVDRVSVSASVGVAAVCGPDPADPVVPAVDPDGLTGDDVAAHLLVATPAGPPDPLAALSAAGAALRTAKSLGRDRVVVFDDLAARTRRRRLLVEERLRVAVSADALQVAFHPIVRLSDGQVVGAEALARWTDDVLGVVDPAEFIAVAEETGLVVALGELVLHRTLGEAVRHDLPGRGLYVGCNVSPVQLRVPGFDRLVIEALTAHGVPASALVVEVTEAVLIEEDSPAVRTLRRLATSGITVAIDDFGTGYSALGYLRRLPAHALKVDRSLTASLAQDTRDRAIVAAVVELGRSMGLDVVVEGIETPEDADLVTALGAGFGQGALYGPAVPAAELVALAARRGDARGA